MYHFDNDKARELIEDVVLDAKLAEALANTLLVVSSGPVKHFSPHLTIYAVCEHGHLQEFDFPNSPAETLQVGNLYDLGVLFTLKGLFPIGIMVAAEATLAIMQKAQAGELIAQGIANGNSHLIKGVAGAREVIHHTFATIDGRMATGDYQVQRDPKGIMSLGTLETNPLTVKGSGNGLPTLDHTSAIFAGALAAASVLDVVKDSDERMQKPADIPFWNAYAQDEHPC